MVQTHGPFSERAAAAVAYETLKVISLCHTKAMVHGDIKPSNLMLLQVCCCFFGCACPCAHPCFAAPTLQQALGCFQVVLAW